MDNFDAPPVWQNLGPRYLTVARQRRFNGAEFFDIRQSCIGPDGQFKPTGRGVTIPLDAVQGLGCALVSWSEEADADAI